ncbi:MAG: hypothetical protein M1817_005136 [Caeruleum heppii]|nr:MAG: hypothetical protein M1817_005136 [Caeruleum heppii]
MVTTCPTPGTYTIPANTLTLTSTVTVPGDTATVTYSPGTYTQTATTVTVTVTSQVVTCPYTTETPTSTSTSAAAPETHTPVQYVAPTSENHPAPAPSSSTESSPSVYVAPSLSSYAPASTPSSYTAQPAENDNEKWCMTYSPYTNGGGCKPANEQASDIADIAKKGFSSIRLYSTDCGGLQAVGDAAKQHGLKIVAGVYIDQSGVGKAGEQVQALISWGQFQLVEMIVLGNEAIFNKYVSASDLAAFISSSKQKLQAAGYNGPVTTTEPLNILQEVGSTLCSCLDVVSANIHPFFNKAVTAAEAGDFVAKQLELVSGICPGKTAYNLETGWPSQGNANGAAQPGKKEQEEAIKAIKASAGGKSVFFSYTDDMWKNAGEFGVEQHFGCSHLF